MNANPTCTKSSTIRLKKAGGGCGFILHGDIALEGTPLSIKKEGKGESGTLFDFLIGKSSAPPHFEFQRLPRWRAGKTNEPRRSCFIFL
jgi:hypothetical protein